MLQWIFSVYLFLSLSKAVTTDADVQKKAHIPKNKYISQDEVVWFMCPDTAGTGASEEYSLNSVTTMDSAHAPSICLNKRKSHQYLCRNTAHKYLNVMFVM